jgi:flagellar biosynthetic protein FlhB
MDFIYQKAEFMKQMRMSKHEVKEEYKQAEGDPKIKGKLKQMRMERARKRMMSAVPTADVIITNPTHYAVALKYEQDKASAPIVVAMGVDKVAERIKQLAEENKVPIVRNAPLARALYDEGDLDEEIPFTHYQAVAEVISYVFKLKDKK